MEIKSILKNKKGVLGLDTAKLFVLAILSLVIVCVVTLIVLDSLQGAAGTHGDSVYNSSASIINNTSAAMDSFFGDAGTWFTLIGVVIIILIIAVVIVVVNRMGVGAGPSAFG